MPGALEGLILLDNKSAVFGERADQQAHEAKVNLGIFSILHS